MLEGAEADGVPYELEGAELTDDPKALDDPDEPKEDEDPEGTP